MPFSLSKLPHKLIANEWLVVSVPSVWWRLSDAVPFAVGDWSSDTTWSLRLKHDWVVVWGWAAGDKHWHVVNGHLHRDNDLPAFEDSVGYRAWYVNDQRHRANGLPAREWEDGSKQWFVYGRRHRENGLPAIERANGDKQWFVNGQFHRDAGLPAFEKADGSKMWFVNNQLHRDNGLPAVEDADGGRQWWVRGTWVRSGKS